MVSNISTYLKFANIQMAAEAFFPIGAVGVGKEAAVRAALILGNDRSSKFMPVQAKSFSDDWEVAAHMSNTGTGFSGTLFRCRVTDTARGLVAGELTLSFRSTEFIDDAVRDNQATNAMEIKEKGWAFGQIADMEDWYAKLRVDPALLAGKSFNVTGYSLGGHLATAFALLRDAEAGPGNSVPLPNPILQTYTFNGAGVGTVSAGTTVGLVLQQFQQWRAAPAMMQFQNAELNAVYQSLLGKYTGAIRVAQSDYTRVLQTGAPPAEQAELVEALGRIDKIIHERDRVAGLKAGSAPPAPTGTVDQASLGYQLAVLRASQSTQAVSLFAGISQNCNFIKRHRARKRIQSQSAWHGAPTAACTNGFGNAANIRPQHFGAPHA